MAQLTVIRWPRLRGELRFPPLDFPGHSETTARSAHPGSDTYAGTGVPVRFSTPRKICMKHATLNHFPQSGYY